MRITTVLVLALALTLVGSAQEVLHPEVLRARSQVSRALNAQTRDQLRSAADAAPVDLTPEQALTDIRSQVTPFSNDWLLQLYFGTRWLENHHQKLARQKARQELLERGLQALDLYLKRVDEADSSKLPAAQLDAPSEGPPRVVETEAGLYVLRLLPWPDKAGPRQLLKDAAKEDREALKERLKLLQLDNSEHRQVRAAWGETLLHLARRIEDLDNSEILELVPESLSLDRR